MPNPVYKEQSRDETERRSQHRKSAIGMGGEMERRVICCSEGTIKKLIGECRVRRNETNRIARNDKKEKNRTVPFISV